MVVIGGIVGILATILALIEPSLGWWEVQVDSWTDSAIYVNAFGYGTNDSELGPLFIVSASLFLAGCVLTFLAVNKKSKGIVFLCVFLMIASIGLFSYGLYANENFSDVAAALSFLSGTDQNVFFGVFGIWTWRLGNGFFIALGGTVITLIGAIKFD